MNDVPTDAQIRALPKAELHVHVEGAVTTATIATIAKRNGVDLGVDDPADLYRYRDLADFLRVFDLVCRSLQTAGDLHQVTLEALAIAAAAGVRYREMFFSPTFLLRNGVAFTDIWDGIAAGIADAEADHGIVCRMILDVHKPAGPAAADELIDLAAGCDRDVLIGIGGDAGEADVDLAAFAGPLARARQLGFHTTMHLGEEGPVDDIRIGLHELGIERIDHGFCVVDDRAVLDEVVERRIPLTVCPTSNLSIGLVDSIEQHPIMQMRDAGVLVTVNSDNAEMFGIDLADEMCNMRDAFGLGMADIEDLCLAAVDASWADQETKRAMRNDFLCEMEQLR
jgi:adenosine deaminase